MTKALQVFHCVTQLREESWEYRYKEAADKPNPDDLVPLEDVVSLIPLQALVKRIDEWCGRGLDEDEYPIEFVLTIRRTLAAILPLEVPPEKKKNLE